MNWPCKSCGKLGGLQSYMEGLPCSYCGGELTENRGPDDAGLLLSLTSVEEGVQALLNTEGASPALSRALELVEEAKALVEAYLKTRGDDVRTPA